MAFDAVLASRVCVLSDLAYDCIGDDNRNPDGYKCEDNFAYIIRREGDRTLIAFQGSNDIKDFLIYDAFAIIRRPDSEPTFPAVHMGFWRAAQKLIDPLREDLSKGAPQPIVLGGHSLGGAIAVLMAVLLREQGHDVEAVYGFGTPPCGAVQFSNYYAALGLTEKTLLTVYRHDAVPFLQPCGIAAAPQIFLDERAYLLSRREGFAWLNPFRWSAWRKDHSADGYLAALAKIADRGGL